MATCVKEKKCFKSNRKRERERQRERVKRGRVAERDRERKRDREIINGGIKGSLSRVIVIFLGEI